MKPVAILFATTMALLILTQGCYSPRKLPASRLEHTLQMEGIQYIAMDVNTPEENVWLLSDLVLEDQALTARFDKAPDGFGKYVQKIKSSQAQRANRDFVHMYLPTAYTLSIQDHTVQRLEFNQIQKIIVFEPDAAENTGVACMGVWGVGILYGVIYWALEGFY